MLRAELTSPIEYYTRTWTTDDGLPHNSVSEAFQDTAGYMWFATVGGLARFDGREFREIRPPSRYSTSGYNIRGVAEEKPGCLIVVTTGRDVLRFQEHSWSVHPVSLILTELNDTPADVAVDPAGSVWVITGNGRILKWTPDGTYKMIGNGRSFVTAPNPISLVNDAKGGTWICGDAAWFVDPSGELTPLPAAGDNPETVGKGREGRAWLWSDRKLLRLEGGRIVNAYPAPTDVRLGRVRHLFEDSTGIVWIATSRKGLYCFADGKMRPVSVYPSTSYVTEDREKNIWVATDAHGVGQLREKAYRLFDSAKGLSKDVVSSLAEDPAGRVWIANRSGGIAYVDQAGLQRSGLTGSAIFSTVVCSDAQNRIYFGGGRNGLSRWDYQNGVPLRLPAPKESLHVLFRARNGDIWFAANSDGLGYYRGDELHSLMSAPRYAPQQIRAIAEDREGNIWLGSRSGELICWDGNAFRSAPLQATAGETPIHALYIDESDIIWIATAHGLIIKNGDNINTLGEANGLADDILQSIVEDRQGNLWFAARRGIFHVAKADLLAAVRDRTFRVESHRLGPHQGLVGLTPSPNFSPTAFRAHDGNLWFATAQGALAVDPTRLPRDLPPPPVLIDEVRVDGRAVPTKPALRIPSGQHRIEFKLAVLSFTAPENIVLRHKLDGADPGWIDTAPDRTANYTRLPPGSYRLHAIARNSTGQWNDVGASIILNVIPAWWETTLFRLASLLMLIAAVAWAARYLAHLRVRRRMQELEQQNALEKERIRIARDLHDDLGAGLTEVALVADRLVSSAPRELESQISNLAWRTRRLATELSGIIWTMNAESASLAHFARFLRRYADRLFRNTGIHCTVAGVENIPAVALPPALQHQLLSVTKEALNNIIKHAHATETQITVSYTDGMFDLRIEDNGAGFSIDGAASAAGNGLRNIRARATEIGAKIDIRSAPGSGTRLILNVPCPAAENVNGRS
ncbi:MAG TPA: two-component regulator propeller domain-containing protein [Opitutaceae bacterium]|nr:two-component regulator propeller domain-containing protein [Opitutaceae bacterium]